MFQPEKPQKSKPQAELLLDLMRDYCFQRVSSAQIWACFPKCRDKGRWLWPLRPPFPRLLAPSPRPPVGPTIAPNPQAKLAASLIGS